MEAAQLKAEIRQNTGKGNANKLRKEGFVPAVFYGKEIGSKGIKVKSNELEKLINRYGENALVKLVVEEDGAEQEYTTLIREIQRHPIKDEITHVDFNQISMKHKLDTTVAVHLVGEAKGVKDGGILQHGAREIDIRCLPINIPEHVEADISDLGIGDNLTVADLDLGEGIEILSEEDTILATVIAPTLEAEKAEGEEQPAAEEE
ncbi:MAG: large subunit ribosomal protein [Clostridia bacterium]|jgi:large subunit ribosomal protein L25|nr:ribosomal protein L25/ral stress protein Ctc [Clostridiales bacterium]MDK2985224.1 large subunit ribosomal protein [Clostridia bacterium]